MSKSKAVRIDDKLYELVENKVNESPFFKDFSSYVRYLIITDLKKEQDVNVK